jgi:hypothetical protein
VRGQCPLLLRRRIESKPIRLNDGVHVNQRVPNLRSIIQSSASLWMKPISRRSPAGLRPRRPGGRR